MKFGNRNKMEHEDLSHFVKDCRYIADKDNLPYDAKQLSGVYKRDYHLYRLKIPKHITETDYIMCQMNMLLEIMIDFYGRKKQYRNNPE